MTPREILVLLAEMESAIRKNQQQIALQAILKLRGMLGEKVQEDSKAKNLADYQAAIKRGGKKIKPAEIGM